MGRRAASGIAVLLCAGLLGAAPGVAAQGTGDGPLRVIGEEAISFTAFLDKAEFDKRFPGERVAERSDLEPGYYVIYRHRSLNYFFGPILLESTGEDYLSRLEGIVEEAVAQRPSIRDYTLELRYEPDTPPEAGGGEASEEAPENAPGSGPPPTQRRNRGLFDWFFRIFGL